MKRFHVILLVLMVARLAAAISIEWSSDLNAGDLQSDGVTPLDEGFEFVLGTFVGLTPGSENLGDWEATFRPFGTADYSPEWGGFSNSQSLANNAAPFETTARAYIWGRNGTDSGSEWILIGKPAWKWPNANPGGPPPFPVRWLVAMATEPEDVVLGAVNETGDGKFYMETALAEFDLTYEAWVEQEFDSGEPSLPEADFDGDGRSNFLEYALDSDPRTKDPPFHVELNSRLEIFVPRVPGRQVEWLLQGSEDLSGFTTMTTGFEIVVDEPDELVFKIVGALENRKFFRVKAVPTS
jgi:hypothetical protein